MRLLTPRFGKAIKPEDFMLPGKTCLIAWALILMYYTVGRLFLAKASRLLAVRLAQSPDRSFLDIEQSTRFVLAAVVQGVFCIVLLLVVGVHFGQLGFRTVTPPLLLLGAVLGLGEMGLSSLVCYGAMQGVRSVAPASVPSRLEDWLALIRAGWMREIVSAFHTIPLGVSVGAITLYITGEEIIFRSILISVALPLGALAAITSSTLLFAFVQIVHMPSWRSGLFPVVGALFTGSIHGILFVMVPEIWPLVVAHLILFASAVS
jgi:hypothetical protein